MIAAVAAWKAHRGVATVLGEDINPNLPLGS
jgi:hypothetical protein